MLSVGFDTVNAGVSKIKGKLVVVFEDLIIVYLTYNPIKFYNYEEYNMLFIYYATHYDFL